jgi:hypothetical protein
MESPIVIGLLHEIGELRRQIEDLQAATGARSRLTLLADRAAPLLGQPVTVTLRVTDPDGRGRAGVPVVLSTTWGRLRPADSALAAGAALATVTGDDGTAGAVLLPAAAQPLTLAQEAALLTALDVVDATTPTPQHARAGLEELARQYRWEPSRDLREAVDLLLRQRPGGAATAVDTPSLLAVWSRVPALVVAHVLAGAAQDGEGRVVEATAVLSLGIVDWLGPWLSVYLDVSRAEKRLEQELNEARRDKDPARILDGVYGRLQRWVTDQRGAVGEAVGRKVAEVTLQGFADRSLEDLPETERAEVRAGLAAASQTLSGTRAGLLAGIGQVRQEARRETATQVGKLDLSGIDRVAGRLDGVESKVAGLDTSLAGVRRDTGTLKTELAADRAKSATFQNETRAALQTKADAGELRTFREQTAGELSDKLSTRDFEAHEKVVNTNFTALQERVAGFRPTRSTLVIRPGGGTLRGGGGG